MSINSPAELTSINDRIASLRIQLEQLEEDLKKKRGERLREEATISKLQKQRQKNLDDVAKSQEDLDIVEAALESKRDEVGGLNKIISNLRAAIASLDKQTIATREEVRNEQARIKKERAEIDSERKTLERDKRKLVDDAIKFRTKASKLKDILND